MGVIMNLENNFEEDEEKLLEKLKTVKERVEYLLKMYPNSRNSDFYLIILYIRKFVPELASFFKYIPYDIIKKYDGLFESLRRCRQKIQEDGRFLPTDPEILKKRRKLAEKFRKILPHL